MKSQNFIALRNFRDTLRNLELQNIDDNPSLYVFMRLLELFQEFDLPVEHVGKIHVDVGIDFFEDKKMASDIILAMVKYCEHIYDTIFERVQDEEVARQIFGDFLDRQSTGLAWYGVPENPPPSLDEDDYTW